MKRVAGVGGVGGVALPALVVALGMGALITLPGALGYAGLAWTLGLLGLSWCAATVAALSLTSIVSARAEGRPRTTLTDALGEPLGRTLTASLHVGLALTASVPIILLTASVAPHLGVDVTDPHALRLLASLALLLVVMVAAAPRAVTTAVLILTLVAAAAGLATAIIGRLPWLADDPALDPAAAPPGWHVILGLPFASTTAASPYVVMALVAVTPTAAALLAGVSGAITGGGAAIAWRRGAVIASVVGFLALAGLVTWLALMFERSELVDARAPLVDGALLDGALVIAGAVAIAVGAALVLLRAAAAVVTEPDTESGARPRLRRSHGGLLLAFGVAEAGVLLGDLSLAAAVATVALATLSGAITLGYLAARATNPGFRPQRTIGPTLGVIGILASGAVLALLDPLLLAAAPAMVAGLFLVLRRSARVDEAALDPLTAWGTLINTTRPARAADEASVAGWHPNLLLFTERGAASRAALIPAVSAWVHGRGLVTDFELHPAEDAAPADAAAPGGAVDPAELVELLHRPTPTADPWRTMEALTRYYGFAGLEPNALVVDWALVRARPDGFAALATAARERGLGVIVAACGEHAEVGRRRRVDLWVGTDGSGLALGMALGHAAAAPGRAELRVTIAGEDHTRAERLLQAARTLAESERVACRFVESVGSSAPATRRSRITAESADADLVIVPLSDALGDSGALVEHVEELIAGLRGDLLLISPAPRAEAAFRRRLDPASPRRAERAEAPGALVTPPAPALRAEALRFAAFVEPALTALHPQVLAPACVEHHALVDRIRRAVRRQLEGVSAATSIKRRRKAIGRAQAQLIAKTRSALEEFATAVVPDAGGRLRRAVDQLRSGALRYDARSEAFVVVERSAAEVAPDRGEQGDPRHLRWLKWRLRAGAYLGRRPVLQRVATAKLLPYYLRLRLTDEATGTLERFAAASHDLVRRLGRVITDLVARLAELEERQAGSDQELQAQLAVAGEHLHAELEELDAGLTVWLAEERVTLMEEARALAQGFSSDLGRLDVRRLAATERRVPADARQRVAELMASPERWVHHHTLAINHGALMLGLAGLQRRLAAVTGRVRARATQALNERVLRPIEALHTALVDLRGAVKAGDVPSTGAVSAAQRSAEAASRFEGDELVATLEQETTAAVEELPEALEAIVPSALDALEEHPFVPPPVVVTPLQRLLAELVEIELVGAFQEEMTRLPEDARRALEVAQDVERLVTFAVADLLRVGEAPDEAARGQLVPVIDGGIERVADEVTILRQRAEEIETRMELQLDHLQARMLPEALIGSSSPAARPGTRRSVRAQLTALAQSGKRALRRGLVTLIYRGTGGLLGAPRRASGVRPADELVERTLALVEARTPAPAVLEALPFYYRQLFLSRLAHESGFWIGREDELAAADRAVANHRRGIGGVLLVVGEAGSGKSALASAVVRRHFEYERTFRVRPCTGGDATVAAFDAALVEAFDPGGRGDVAIEELLREATIVIEDLELWWERAEGGFAVIDHVLGLIDRYGDRVFFVVEVGLHAFRALTRFRDLGRRAVAVVECAPLGAHALREVIEARHRAAGLRYQLEGRGEAVLGDLRRARLFAALFTDSRGLVGPALQAWVTAIDHVGDGVLELRVPSALDESVFEALGLDLLALLVQIALHREVTEPRLARITNLAPEALRVQVATLRRAGLLTRRSDGTLALDRYVRHRVVHHLELRGLLP